MKSSFLRFYFAVLLSMIALALGIEGVLSWQSPSSMPWLPADQIFCSVQARPDCPAANGQLRELPMSAVQLPAALMQQLAQGDVVALHSGEQSATLLIQDGARYFSYGPVTIQDEQGNLALVLYLLFFGLLGLLLLLWLWPLFRDLDAVRAALQQAEQGGPIHFPLPRRSMLWPLARAISQLSGDVQQLLQSQREMSHFIAHDLRTPLARMRFALAMLNTEQQDLRTDVLDNVGELERIATEYLQFADDEASHSLARLPAVEAGPFFQLLQHRHNANARPAIQFHFPAEGLFHANAFALERAIDNLIGNARRFANSTIVVRFQQKRGCCVLQVDDDGPGIPLAARQVFGRQLPFSRPRVRGDREQGFGIGLYIVRRVAMLHRGRLKLLSSPIGGARFELIWPDQP